MKIRYILAAILALAAAPAGATDTHDYAKGEYAIIHDGLAPDRQKSLAAHGDGDGGSENFHVWLMAEPAHRKLAVLDGISSDNNLDTGPNAYHATWSADSRHVAVGFRSSRHVTQLNLYAIEGRSAHLVRGPSLFRQVAGRDIDPEEDMRSSFAEIAWRGPRRFVLREQRLFVASDAGFARGLGAHGREAEKGDDGKIFVEFAAEADCELTPDKSYRVVNLRIGKFSR